MPTERVLICGAGVAGSIAAFWLAQHNFQVVVIERSKAEQKLGQGIEIEQPALEVVKAMGIMDQLRTIRTGEQGIDIVDQKARVRAKFEIGGSFSPTGDLEVMRGDFTEVLYKTADRSPNVTYHFETAIKSLRQTQDKVTVEYENRNTKTTSTEEFDLVIGADGARSRTRQLIMGSPEELDCFKPVGAFVAYFSIPKEDQDWPYARICQYPGRRVLWTRPVREGSQETSVYLIHLNNDIPALRKANAANDRQKQKEAFAEIYGGLDWIAPRVIEKMMRSDNFYSDELMQVKLQKWSQGRVVLVGDSAWAPTPFTGQGNQLAIIGAWVLAQELSRNRSPSAFETYEQRLRPYVTESQKIPLGGYAPYFCCPRTHIGIWIFRTIMYLATIVIRLLSSTSTVKTQDERQRDDFDLEMEKSEKEVMR